MPVDTDPQLPPHAYQGKFQIPAPDEHWLPRMQLLERLNRGLGCKLILVSAPLGFGKTTLTVHWLMQVKLPVAWITLDAGDNALLDFVQVLMRSIQQALPGAHSATLSLIENATTLSEQQILDACLAEIRAISQPLLVVLDNCEVLADSNVHRLMRELLAHAPAQLHVMALTRIDPPWHLAKLRLKNQVCDIRGSDLQFSRLEASEYMSCAIRQTLDDETLNWLVEYTEGWPAALQMARLAMNNHMPDALMMSFRGTNRQITEYLADEVFNSLAEPTRQLLLAAAVPNQFCAPLVEHMLSERMPLDNAGAVITDLENAGLFIRPVDAGRVWFRLHPIFRDFLLYYLRQEQGTPAWQRCNLLASDWFNQNGMLEQAIHHALAGRDVERASGMILALIKPISAFATAAVIHRNERLLAQFSEPDCRDRIDLLCMQLHLAVVRGNNLEAVRLMQVITARLADEHRDISPAMRILAQGMVRGIQVEFLFWGGDGAGALAAANEALALLPEDFVFNRNNARIYRIGALCQTRGKAEALAAVQELMQDALSRNDDSIYQAYISTLLVQHVYADLKSVESDAQEMSAVIEARRGGRNWTAFPLYFLGMARLEANDFAGASAACAQVAELGFHGNTRLVHDAMLALALLAQIEGHADRASDLAREARQFAVMMQGALPLEFSTSLEARLALMQGRPQEALEMLVAVKPANTGFAIWFERPCLTKAEVLLALGGADNLKQALMLVATAIADARRMNNMRLLIHGLVVQSTVLQLKGDTANAQLSFTEALRLGQQTGFVRALVSMGAHSEALLKQCVTSPSLATFANRLRRELARSLAPRPSEAANVNRIRDYGITPLTTREMEVLMLVSERQSIDEMAAQLFISSNTVKKHLTNIYGKLHVRNGRQAVAKMREIGLLPPA